VWHFSCSGLARYDGIRFDTLGNSECPFVYFHRSDGQHFHRDNDGRYVVDARQVQVEAKRTLARYLCWERDKRYDRTECGSPGSQRPHNFSGVCDRGNMVIHDCSLTDLIGTSGSTRICRTGRSTIVMCWRRASRASCGREVSIRFLNSMFERASKGTVPQFGDRKKR
jgi:hypothetical protein